MRAQGSRAAAPQFTQLARLAAARQALHFDDSVLTLNGVLQWLDGVSDPSGGNGEDSCAADPPQPIRRSRVHTVATPSHCCHAFTLLPRHGRSIQLCTPPARHTRASSSVRTD